MRYSINFALFLLAFVKCERNRGIFESADYWNVTDRPVMANGHIGFVPYGDSVYMNGFYNGFKGDSHRARIPNYANVQFNPCSERNHRNSTCSYTLDINDGVFRTRTQLHDGQFTVVQTQYAHRYYETALVNQIHLKRNQRTTKNSFSKIF